MERSNGQERGLVLALAGRRIDAPGADAVRFPLANAPAVRRRLADLMSETETGALVCSAACGADLLALEAAEELGLRRRIVLPFAADRFRETSVVDRPGDWGQVYDRLIDAARASGDLVVVDGGDGDAAYAAANAAIVREAKAIAGGPEPRDLAACVVWEGASRGANDATERFRRLAVEAGCAELSVRTF